MLIVCNTLFYPTRHLEICALQSFYHFFVRDPKPSLVCFTSIVASPYPVDKKDFHFFI